MEPISKVNLERITNGIYAFTMTLLVRNIYLPQAGTVTGEAALDHYLFTTVTSFIDFVGAFLILGMFWLFYFQMFHQIRSVDFRFIHLHLLSLMIVVFVPFTQSFAAEQLGIPISEVLFQVNYFCLSLLLIFQWHHVRSNPGLLKLSLHPAEATYLNRKFLVPLGVSLIGILLVLLGLPYIDILYMLPFVILGFFFRSPPCAHKENNADGEARDSVDIAVPDAAHVAEPEKKE